MKSPADVPDDEINEFTHLNATRHSRYDHFAHASRNRATVSALRSKTIDWDVGIKSVMHLRPALTAESAKVVVNEIDPGGVERVSDAIGTVGPAGQLFQVRPLAVLPARL